MNKGLLTMKRNQEFFVKTKHRDAQARRVPKSFIFSGTAGSSGRIGNIFET